MYGLSGILRQLYRLVFNVDFHAEVGGGAMKPLWSRLIRGRGQADFLEIKKKKRNLDCISIFRVFSIIVTLVSL